MGGLGRCGGGPAGARGLSSAGVCVSVAWGCGWGAGPATSPRRGTCSPRGLSLGGRPPSPGQAAPVGVPHRGAALLPFPAALWDRRGWPPGAARRTGQEGTPGGRGLGPAPWSCASGPGGRGAGRQTDSVGPDVGTHTWPLLKGGCCPRGPCRVLGPLSLGTSEPSPACGGNANLISLALSPS